ncbi:MAG: hypothetical protein JRI68_07565 [Deltaproteobacteria bacterium]|nr:hypothetical protein [Deltaproteobacteria bacterium]
MRLLALIGCLLLASCGDSFTGGEGGGGGTGGTSSSSGTGGSTSGTPGCSDGTRELFDDLTAEPRIAGCEGGFSVPGVTTQESQELACDRKAGNNSENAAGEGCSVADLCAAGWHVCESAADVAASLTSAIACPETPNPSFWITRQATNDTTDCVNGGVNNLVGCGSEAGEDAAPSCSPLDTMMLFSSCQSFSGWYCGTANEGTHESQVVTKSIFDQGGVLCCKD